MWIQDKHYSKDPELLKYCSILNGGIKQKNNVWQERLGSAGLFIWAASHSRNNIRSSGLVRTQWILVSLNLTQLFILLTLANKVKWS